MASSKLKKWVALGLGLPLAGITSVFTFVQIRYSQDASRIYEAPAFTIADQVKTADVELGKRIYHVRGGCIDCHGADLAGIQVMDDPAMGTVHGANITPFNLSSWSDEEIARAVRYGIHKTGRSLRFMPSMDWVEMSQGDIAAVIAYLRSMPSVERPSVEPKIGLVAKALSVAGQIPILFPAKAVAAMPAGFRDKPAEGPTPEFGRYLAASCTGCHGAEFKGGKIPGGAPDWPEASNIRLGADSRWMEANFKEMLKTGVSPISKQKLLAPMPTHLLAQMDETEGTALWLYLSSLK